MTLSAVGLSMTVYDLNLLLNNPSLHFAKSKLNKDPEKGHQAIFTLDKKR